MSRANPRAPQRLEYLEKWYDKHPDYNKKYYAANRNKILAQQKEYTGRNMEKYRLYQHTRRQERRAFIADTRRFVVVAGVGTGLQPLPSTYIIEIRTPNSTEYPGWSVSQ